MKKCSYSIETMKVLDLFVILWNSSLEWKTVFWLIKIPLKLKIPWFSGNFVATARVDDKQYCCIHFFFINFIKKCPKKIIQQCLIAFPTLFNWALEKNIFLPFKVANHWFPSSKGSSSPKKTDIWFFSFDIF